MLQEGTLLSRSTIQYIIKSIEWLLLMIIGVAYWYPSPIRDQWAGIIIIWATLLLFRYIIHKRLWTHTPLEELFVLFLGFCLINIFLAPYETRGFILLLRPIFGFALVLACVEHARVFKSVHSLYIFTLIFGTFLGTLSIVSTNWSGKSDFLDAVYTIIPRIEIFLASGGFNPNEIAGAVVVFLPFSIWFLVKRRYRFASIPVITILSGLFLGQSLSGMLGAILGTLTILVPQKYWRYIVLVCVSLIALTQILIMISPERAASLLGILSPRANLQSMEHRAELWRSAVDILHDYPLTGAGIAMYRNPQVREDYPTPNFSPRQAVHPHNNVLQFTSDLGIPGLLIVLGWYTVTAYMIYTINQKTNNTDSSIAVAFSGSMIAYLAFGLTDAIPIWDRFGFLFFWFLGLISAQYKLCQVRNLEDKCLRTCGQHTVIGG